jgi:hypothetical protein
MTAERNLLLLVAVAVMIGGQLAWFFSHPISVIGVIILVAVGVLSWFLLRGNKIAWTLAMLSGVTQLVGPLAWDQPAWFAGSGAILLVCLLYPSSRVFVWS